MAIRVTFRREIFAADKDTSYIDMRRGSKYGDSATETNRISVRSVSDIRARSWISSRGDSEHDPGTSQSTLYPVAVMMSMVKSDER